MHLRVQILWEEGGRRPDIWSHVEVCVLFSSCVFHCSPYLLTQLGEKK